MTSNAHETTEPAAPTSALPVVRSVLVDVAPPLVAYYGLRALGATEYVALVSATVLAGLKVTYTVMKSRRVDLFAAYLLLSFGLSLVVALITVDPRSLLVGNSIANGLGGIVFLLSCFKTPLTQVVSDRVRRRDDDAQISEEEHRTHVKLSLLWGAGLLIETGARLILIYCLPVDVANGVVSTLSLTVMFLLLGISVVAGRNARRTRSRRRVIDAPPGTETAAIAPTVLPGGPPTAFLASKARERHPEVKRPGALLGRLRLASRSSGDPR